MAAHLDAAGWLEGDPLGLAAVPCLLEGGPKDGRGQNRDHRGEAAIVARHQERVGRPGRRVLDGADHSLLRQALALGDAALEPPVPEGVVACRGRNHGNVLVLDAHGGLHREHRRLCLE